MTLKEKYKIKRIPNSACELDEEIVSIANGSSCAVWDFRANENVYTSEILLNFMKSNCKKFVFQKEKGDSGYIHWQGRFSLIKKRRKQELLLLFASIGKPNYLEPTSSVNHSEVFFYVLKEDTRIGDLFMDNIHKKLLDINDLYVPRHLRNLQLFPWQKSIIDSGKDFDNRIIDVLVDPSGNIGKSTLSSIGDLLHNCVDMPVLRDSKEIVSVACNICMDMNNRSPAIFFFDMPRAFNKSDLSDFYVALEQIKKGKLYDVRYHYKYYWIDSPRIWVFSNIEPDLSMVSMDRWRLWQIDDKTNSLIPYVAKDIDYVKKDSDLLVSVIGNKKRSKKCKE